MVKPKDHTVRACLLFMTFVLTAWVLYWMRGILTPFALAIFFWLIIDAFARWLDEKLVFLPYVATLVIAVLVVAAGLLGMIVIIADTAVDVAREAPQYQRRIGEIIGPITERFGDLTWSSLDARFNINQKIQGLLAGFAGSVQGVLSSFALIALYVAFLFATQHSFPQKMDELFPDVDKRQRAQLVGLRIRESIEKYLGIQTLMSLIMTILSYAVMRSFGLDNALFWALYRIMPGFKRSS